jgi:hypothetical protein
MTIVLLPVEAKGRYLRATMRVLRLLGVAWIVAMVLARRIPREPEGCCEHHPSL